MGVPFLKSVVTVMIPVLFASIGGLFPALAGTLNIALEGMLLAGAFSSLAVYYFSGSAAMAVAAAAACAAALCALHIFTALKLRANIFICGLAVNLLSGALCTVVSGGLFAAKGTITLQNSAYSGASDLVYPYLFSAIFLLFIAHVVIYNTPFGYRLRACEKNGESLISLGIEPDFYKITAMLICAVFCGIGGSFLSLNLGAFVPGMSAGKGWIALVVIFLGGRKPFGLLAAVLVFAAAESFTNYAQGFWKLPSEFILSLPYVCTLIAMLLSRKTE